VPLASLLIYLLRDGGITQMKPNNAHKWLLLGLTLSVSALTTSPAQAEVGQWLCTHGLAGQVENEGNLNDSVRRRTSWGLDIDQKAGRENWVHFAPPTIYPWRVTHVALKFWTESADAYIDRVEVYNLGSQIKVFKGFVHPTGWVTKVFPFDPPGISSTALAISAHLEAGVKDMSHRFVFSGACAYLEPPPPASEN